jgi:hypothetical protein
MSVTLEMEELLPTRQRMRTPVEMKVSWSYNGSQNPQRPEEGAGGMGQPFMRNPAEPMPPPVKEPPEPEENPDAPVREPDPEEPQFI